MKVWHKQTIRWTANGKRATKTTPGARRHLDCSKKFYGTLKLASGKRKQQPLAEERMTSLKLLRRLQTIEDDKRACGITEQAEARQRAIAGFLEEYAARLQGKGDSDLHCVTTLSRIRTLLTATKIKTIADLDAGRIVKALAEWRGRRTRPISITTSNHYAVAIKGFTRWLWQERKSPDDPLAGLRRMNAEMDRKRVRRPLTPTELNTLTTSTLASRKRYLGNDWQMTATDRVMLYWTAALTGLRAKELASLTKCSFDFAAMTYILSAAAAKNRKATLLPLNRILGLKLQSWFATLNRDTLWPGSWAERRMGGKMLKRDLKRAGIPYCDASGRYADFHALRHTFITSLAKAGVHPAKAQRLARHSTIALTMNVYTTLDVDDLRQAVDALTVT